MTLTQDDEILVADVRCADAPIPPGPLEQPPSIELVIPLSGVFERELFPHGSRRPGIVSIGDASRVHLFRPSAPHRIAHPIGGSDRAIAIALRDGLPNRLTYPDDIPAPPRLQTAARRLAAAVAQGAIDDLAAAETAWSLVNGCLGLLDRTEVATTRDRATARRIRLEIAGHLQVRLSLPKLGRRVGLSGWEAARRFRRATGTSIHRYRTGLRVQAALDRIERGERDLTALALDLGFAHHSHLANVLRSTLGSPPSAFRRAPTAAELAALRTILQA